MRMPPTPRVGILVGMLKRAKNKVFAGQSRNAKKPPPLSEEMAFFEHV